MFCVLVTLDRREDSKDILTCVQKELLKRGDMITLDEVIENIETRDRIDSTRSESPLIQAEDAIVLDNSGLTMEQQVNMVIRWVDDKLELQTL